uniref:7-cyano-7-deazaguanine synthase n=1 Tax=Agathobacter sp. TaxID=2021311 RepID=UPI004056124E
METRILLDWESFKYDKGIRFGAGTANWKDSVLNTEILKSIYGNFAIVEESEEKVQLVSDVIRSIPIFYAIHNEILYVSDYAEKIQKETNAAFMERNVEEFLQTGYVTENETIFKNIYQVLPGEIIEISKKSGNIKREHYFELVYTCGSTETKEELIEELDKCMEAVFCDLIKRLNGRTALIPLSGGCDSRTVAVMLKRLGYEKVICFSYGVSENDEAKCSETVAKNLGGVRVAVYRIYSIEMGRILQIFGLCGFFAVFLQRFGNWVCAGDYCHYGIKENGSKGCSSNPRTCVGFFSREPFANCGWQQNI